MPRLGGWSVAETHARGATTVNREPLDHTGVLNVAGKYPMRRPDAPLSDYAEPWRFPIIDAHHTETDGARLNHVTFVWRAASRDETDSIAVVGSFDNLWNAIPLETVLFDGSRRCSAPPPCWCRRARSIATSFC